MMSSRSSAASSRDDAATSHPIMKTSKICGVCGDVARCYHFGGLCCASCKAFFRRAVVNDQYKIYRCVYGGSCRIDIMTRKHCSHCRLNRCRSIGMDKKWFMSEEMRLELRIKAMKKLKPPPQPNLMLLDSHRYDFFRSSNQREIIISPDQVAEIDTLVQLCRVAYRAHAFPEELQSEICPSSTAQTAAIFSTVIRRVFSFLESVPQLRQLDMKCRMNLLKEHGMEALIVLSTLTYNPEKRMWIKNSSTLVEEPRTVHVCAADFERLHGPAVTRKHLDTITSLLNMNADERIITLLALIAFFTLDDQQQQSEWADQILVVQEHFIDLLKCYIRCKFVGDVSETIFTRFILKLSDVREVNNLHKVTRLRLSNDEVHQLDRHMGGLDLIKFISH